MGKGILLRLSVLALSVVFFGCGGGGGEVGGNGLAFQAVWEQPAGTGTLTFGDGPADYNFGTAISGDWQTRVLKILEILRPAGVSFTLTEGSTAGDGTFQFDIGPGFDKGRLARRVI